MTRLLALIGALAIAGAVVVAGFFFGGFFNIAASENDPPFVAQQIVRVRVASIARHAPDGQAAGQFRRSCARAGGREAVCRQRLRAVPRRARSRLGEILGRPQSRSAGSEEEAGNLEPQEVFWIVKHGIRMTGMPSFAAAGVSDDDIWSIAAFVKKIASVSEADYAAWTAPLPRRSSRPRHQRPQFPRRPRLRRRSSRNSEDVAGRTLPRRRGCRA